MNIDITTLHREFGIKLKLNVKRAPLMLYPQVTIMVFQQGSIFFLIHQSIWSIFICWLLLEDRFLIYLRPMFFKVVCNIPHYRCSRYYLRVFLNKISILLVNSHLTSWHSNDKREKFYMRLLISADAYRLIMRTLNIINCWSWSCFFLQFVV